MAKETISSILNTSKKEMDAATKIAKIAAIVAKARKEYGNTDKEISDPVVHTCEGAEELAYLTNEDKLALVAREVTSIRKAAICAEKTTEGIVAEKEIIRAIAVNPILANITAASDSDYI